MARTTIRTEDITASAVTSAKHTMPKAKKQEEVPQNVVSIDGSEYKFDDLADEAKLAISHIAQLEGEMNALRRKLAQLEAARSVFKGQLKSALPE